MDASSLAARWRLDGHAALLTGGSHGIGLACAQDLLALGADLLIVARDDVHLREIRTALAQSWPARRIGIFAADVAAADQRDALLTHVRQQDWPISLLVNNVGANLNKATLDYSVDEYEQLMQVNLQSSFEMCRLVHPLLAAHGDAAIVNVGSVAGLTSVGTGTPYAMAKAALHQLTRSLACEWGAQGIRVNSVAPWYIRTRRTAPALADADYEAQVLARTPLQRIGTPAEVAAAIAFLCLPAASYISGQCLAVDGAFLQHGF